MTLCLQHVPSWIHCSAAISKPHILVGLETKEKNWTAKRRLDLKSRHRKTSWKNWEQKAEKEAWATCDSFLKTFKEGSRNRTRTKGWIFQGDKHQVSRKEIWYICAKASWVVSGHGVFLQGIFTRWHLHTEGTDPPNTEVLGYLLL